MTASGPVGLSEGNREVPQEKQQGHHENRGDSEIEHRSVNQTGQARQQINRASQTQQATDHASAGQKLCAARCHQITLRRW